MPIDWDDIRYAIRKLFLLEANTVLAKFKEGQWHGADTEAVKHMALEVVKASFDIGTHGLDRGLQAAKVIEGHAKGAVLRELH